MNARKGLSYSALILAVTFPFGWSGCAREVSHTESNKENLTGGETHRETTVYKNPDGSVSVEKEKDVTH